jgi:hypothetical protein
MTHETVYGILELNDSISQKSNHCEDGMGKMSSEKLSAAIKVIKSGDKATGRRLLAEILKEDPSNETSWIWLATCVEEVERKKYCLQKALVINPDNQTYKIALEQLELPPQSNLGDTHPEVKTGSPPAESTYPLEVIYKRWASIYLFVTILAVIVLAWILLRWSFHKPNNRRIP